MLSEALASYASDAQDPPIQEGDRLQAAVSLVLRARPNLEVLLIKRAKSERDPWSGHMALPGGRRDYDDMNIVDTAMREAMEEVGLDLKLLGKPLGRLDDVAPSSPHLPSLTITPFVFGIGALATAHVASYEVAEVFWVPIDDIRDPAALSTVEIQLPSGPRDFPCYRVAGEVVWGLTFQMITQFLEIYPHLELAKTAAATIKGGNQPDNQNARATAEKKKRAELPPPQCVSKPGSNASATPNSNTRQAKRRRVSPISDAKRAPPVTKKGTTT